MRLSALDVRFLSLSGAKLTAKPVEGYISLLCPKCFIANTGKEGTHRINLPFSSNPNHWHATGKSIEDFSFVPLVVNERISVAVVGGCEAHFNIVDGAILLLNRP